jgi:hypothetical protein
MAGSSLVEHSAKGSVVATRVATDSLLGTLGTGEEGTARLVVGTEASKGGGLGEGHICKSSAVTLRMLNVDPKTSAECTASMLVSLAAMTPGDFSATSSGESREDLALRLDPSLAILRFSGLLDPSGSGSSVELPMDSTVSGLTGISRSGVLGIGRLLDLSSAKSR